jgi:hypothetical protein
MASALLIFLSSLAAAGSLAQPPVVEEPQWKIENARFKALDAAGAEIGDGVAIAIGGSTGATAVNQIVRIDTKENKTGTGVQSFSIPAGRAVRSPVVFDAASDTLWTVCGALDGINANADLLSR